MRELEWCIREGLISGQNELDTLCSAASIAFGSKLHLGKLRCLGHFGARFDPSCGLPPRRELLLGCQVFLRIWMLRFITLDRSSFGSDSRHTCHWESFPEAPRAKGNNATWHCAGRIITRAILSCQVLFLKCHFFAIFLLQPTLPVSEKLLLTGHVHKIPAARWKKNSYLLSPRHSVTGIKAPLPPL